MRVTLVPGRRVLAVLVLLGLVLLLLASPAHAGKKPRGGGSGSIGVRLLEAPVALQDDPRALTYVIDDLEPGDSITRGIEVSNTTKSVQDVSIYSGPAGIKRGSWLVGEPGSANELTSWTSTSLDAMQLAPGERRDVDVTIDVPAKASGGERYGVVWAAVSSPQGQVTVVNRVGIRMYLNVSGPEAAVVDFEIDRLVPSRGADGAPVLRATVRNTGERALDLNGKLRLSDGPGGAKAGPFVTDGATTLGIGQTVDVPVTLDADLPDGPWTATLVMRSGTVKRTATATVTFPGSPSQAGPAVTPRTAGLPDTGSGSNLPGLLVLALGLAMIPPLFLLWRRRREEEEELVSVNAVTDDEWLASLDRWAGPGAPS